MMTHHDTFAALPTSELAGVTGGISAKTFFKKAGKFVAKRALGPVGAAWTGYDAVDGYLTAREHGKSVPDSIKDGAVNAVF